MAEINKSKHGLALCLCLTLIFSSLFAVCFSGLTVAAAEAKAQAAFEGPFFYTGATTTTYQYFSKDSDLNTQTSTLGKLTIDPTKTVTVTEDQILTYYLHIPKNYDPNKSYPIISYCSGDGISIFCDSEIKGTVFNFQNLAEDSEYAILKDKYRQNVSYGTTYINAWGVSIDTSGHYLTQYYEYQGDKKQTLKLPAYGIKGTAGNRDDQFVENWYELVYTQNKEEYDCFFIYIQPIDRMWWENRDIPKLVNMQNQTQSSEIVSKYDSSVIQSQASAGSDFISSTYVTRELSPIVDAQLLCRLIDELAEKYSIDLRRQYIAGYSLGAQFAYDTACHYPDRFACVMTSGLPICDLTDENCKALINTNFWIFNGTGDMCDANCYFNRQFIAKINRFRTELGGSSQESYFTVAVGGHLGSYMAGDSRRADGDDKGQPYASFDEGGTDTYDFMFNSVRSDGNEISNKSDKNSAESVKVSAKVSSTLTDGKYDLVLISGAPLGDFSEQGFAVTTSENKDNAYDKTKTIAVNGRVKSAEVTLGTETITLNATDYNSAFIYVYKISGIPSDKVTAFDVKSYAVATSGIYYSDSVHIEIDISGDTVSCEVK